MNKIFLIALVFVGACSHSNHHSETKSESISSESEFNFSEAFKESLEKERPQFSYSLESKVNSSGGALYIATFKTKATRQPQITLLVEDSTQCADDTSISKAASSGKELSFCASGYSLKLIDSASNKEHGLQLETLANHLQAILRRDSR